MALGFAETRSPTTLLQVMSFSSTALFWVSLLVYTSVYRRWLKLKR